MLRSSTLIALLALTGTTWIVPVDAQEESLTLDQCVSLALEQNPLVLSAREEYRASLARISQARELPQPSLNFDSDLQPGITNLRGSQEQYIGIGAQVPFPGRTRLRGRIAQQESGETQADVETLKLDLTFRVNEAFFDLLLTRERITYARQNLDFSQDFVEKTELKFAAGDVPQVEVIRARVEAARAVTELRRAETEEDLARARMNFLLARPQATPVEIHGQLKAAGVSQDLEQLTDLAFSSRPEMSRIESSIEKAALTRRLGMMSYLPDFDVGAAQHRIAGEPNTWDVTLSVNLPLFFWQPARGKIREATAHSRALIREATHLRNLISLEVEEAHRKYLTAVNQIQLIEEEILAQAEQVYEMYVFSYQHGDIGGIELIEAQRTLNEARKSYADSLYDYSIAIASLEKSVGRALGGN
ncbi:TolC family protein [Gemmatimonadota bacterium]